MKLIILSGQSNCGKTQTLNLLYNYLNTNHLIANSNIIHLGNPVACDYEYVLELTSSKKLVISTWGDYPFLLKQCCSKYHNYDAVVCACNIDYMRNRVYKPFEDAMMFDNLATVVLKTPNPNVNQQNISNNTCAQYLFDLLKHFNII